MNVVGEVDVAVVGAGPYGLSVAAHLLARGLTVAIHGRPMDLWRHHMPSGMLMRSQWWASDLSDPQGQYRFERFMSISKCRKAYPMAREAFIEYGLWFQEHAVPGVDETYVSSVERRSGRFLLTLENGRTVTSAAVVMATGLSYYTNRPQEYARQAAELVSHSCDHHDFSRFRGKNVVVIGGGQSAVEYAALLHEAGAAVDLVSRRPVVWLGPDKGHQRPLIDRLLAPNANIAPGWKNWILDRVPYAFYRFPQARKDSANRNYYLSAASDWLKARVIGKVRLHEGETVVGMEPMRERVGVRISSGDSLSADHVVLATGYAVDIDRLTMIHPSLRAEIETDTAVPMLNAWFESSVPGFYFVGLTSLRAFGPLYRFVAGCDATARRVAGSIARKRSVAPE